MSHAKTNKYRITFISPQGVEQRTILSAASLPDLIRRVESIIADPAGSFTNDKKNNTYFKVVKENIAYIQYELLFSDKEVNIEKIKHIAPEIITTLVNTVRNAEMYALALLGVDYETKDVLLREMDSALKEEVEKQMNMLWEASELEMYKAQEVMLDEIITIVHNRYK